MEKQDLGASLDEGNEKYGGLSDFYKMEEGDNIMRILTSFHLYGEHYHPTDRDRSGVCIGKDENCLSCNHEEKPSVPTARWLAWAVNAEGLKLVKFGTRIMKSLKALQNESDWQFEGFPMPYIINVKATGAGTKEVVYTVIPKKPTEVKEDVMEALEKKLSPADIVQAMKDKKTKGGDGTAEKVNNVGVKGEIDYPEEDINPDDIPF